MVPWQQVVDIITLQTLLMRSNHFHELVQACEDSHIHWWKKLKRLIRASHICLLIFQKRSTRLRVSIDNLSLLGRDVNSILPLRNSENNLNMLTVWVPIIA